MASPSPACTVSDAGGTPTVPTNGMNVGAGHTITVQLSSLTGVSVWEFFCTSTDDLHTAAAINAVITINQLTKTATLTAPSTPCAMLFTSRVNNGKDANFNASAALSISVGVYVLLPNTLRVLALGETFEGNSSYGWTASLNTLARLLSVAAPTIASVSPTHIPATIGGPLTITGTGYLTGVSVTVGGTAATVTSMTGTSIVVAAPTHASGTLSVVVTNTDAQSATSSVIYDAPPTYASISPTTMSTASTTAATITGTGYVATPSVTFGGTAGTVTGTTSTTVSVTAPVKTAGSQVLIITNPDGQSVTSSVTYASPTFGPTTVAGAALFLMSDMGVTTGATFTWADQTANGRNFTQSTGGNQPTVTTGGAGINGVAAIKFVGASSQYLVGPALTALSSGAEVFLVHKPTSDGATQVCHWRTGSFAQNVFNPYIDHKIYDNFGSSSARFAPTATVANAAQVYNVVSTGSEWTAFIDGTQIYTNASNTVGWESAGTLLGGTSAGGITPGASYDGLMVALIIYDHKLSTGDKATVMTGLRAKYGTP